MLDKTARIAVLVSGGGTNLQAILDAQQSGIIKSGRVSLVISNNKDAYALTRAKNAGVECAVIEKTADFERNIVDCLERHGIDLIVLAGFMCILSKDFTARYSERIINVHPSLIPAFCGRGFYGLHVHEAALARGVKLTGATVHFVNEIPDGGRIIAQKAVEIKEGDTPEILQKRVMEQAEWIILPQAVEKVSKELTEAKQ
ncbi:MAG: phosphoribosylglycinamide formyltransferase [Clostridia bacterium]|nr:phosphoribosylglycinamide formyltransferase [Clostridia bacterium]